MYEIVCDIPENKRGTQQLVVCSCGYMMWWYFFWCTCIGGYRISIIDHASQPPSGPITIAVQAWQAWLIKASAQNHKMGPALVMRKARHGGHHSCHCWGILWAYLDLFWPRHGTSHCSLKTFETIHLPKTKKLAQLSAIKTWNPDTGGPVQILLRQDAGEPPNRKPSSILFLVGFADFRKSTNFCYDGPYCNPLPLFKPHILP